MSNSIQHYYSCNVVGVDFNPVAIDFARKTADLIGACTEFRVDDIFKYTPDYLVDIVISIGVLHHTPDCKRGIAIACNHVKAEGYVVVGLYNEYGRKPFIDFFKKLKDEGADEETLFKSYINLDNRHGDMVAAKSWFNDQVLHPHETLHTLSEVIDVFEKNGVEFKLTSINGFQSSDDLAEIFRKERLLYNRGLKHITSGKYDPGFFVVVGQKRKP